MNKKKIAIAAIGVLLLIGVILSIIIMTPNQKDPWEEPEQRSELKRYIPKEKLEKLLDPNEKTYGINNFDGVKIDYKGNKFDLEDILLKDLGVKHGIYDHEFGILNKNTFPIPPKTDFLITAIQEKGENDSLTIGIVNMDTKEQFPDECMIRYLRYRNGQNLKVCGITIGDTKDEIIKKLGEPDPNSNHVKYLFVEKGHIYDISFYLDKQTNKCKEIIVDIDGYSEHGIITY